MATFRQYKFWFIGAGLGLLALVLVLAGQGKSASRAWAQAVSVWHRTRRDRAEVQLGRLVEADDKILAKIEKAAEASIKHEAAAKQALEQADLPAEALKRKINDLYR